MAPLDARLSRTGRRRAFVTAVVLALIVVAAAPANSAAATRVYMVGSQLTIEDTSGGAQAIQVVGGTAMTPMLMVNDTAAGASMVAGDGCMVMFGGGVECLSPAGTLSLLVTLGAGEDTFDSRGITAPVTIDAGADADSVFTGTGADVVTGGDGRDSISSGAGDDAVQLRDGGADQSADCGTGTDSVQLDVIADPAPVDCESSTRTAPGDGAVASTNLTFTMPKLEPVRVGAGYRFSRFEALPAALSRAGFIPNLKETALPLRGVPRVYRDQIDDRQVVAQSPAPGTRVTWQLGRPLPLMRVSYYGEHLDLPAGRCPYGSRSGIEYIVSLARMYEYSRGMDHIRRAGCEARVVSVTESRTVTDTRIAGATVKRERNAARGTVTFYLALTLVRPQVADFAITLTDRPRADWTAAGDAQRRAFTSQLGLGVDGRLTAGAPSTAVNMLVHEIATGRAVVGAPIDIRDGTGRLLQRATTNAFGSVVGVLPSLPVGKLQLDVVVRGTNGATMEGWGTIPVVDRRSQPFATAAGRGFVYSPTQKTYVASTALPGSVQQQLAQAETAMEGALGSSMGRTSLGAVGSQMSEVLAKLGGLGGTPATRLLGAAETGLQPGKLLAGGTTTPAFTPGIMGLTSGVLAQPGGAIGGALGALTQTFPTVRIPGATDLGVAAITNRTTAPVISLGGGGMLGSAVPNLFGSSTLGSIGVKGIGVLPIGGLPILGDMGAGPFASAPVGVASRIPFGGDPAATTLRVY